MEANFKHNLDVEERYFSLDIEALKNYDEGFRQAYDNGKEYDMSIKLSWRRTTKASSPPIRPTTP